LVYAASVHIRRDINAECGGIENAVHSTKPTDDWNGEQSVMYQQRGAFA
jgi:hypothetical protein